MKKLNPGTFAASLQILTLDAAIVGSTSTAVLRFGAAATVAGAANTFAELTTAALGTVISIQRPGVYLYTLRGRNSGANTAIVGASLNTDAAGLTALPSATVVGMEPPASFNGADEAGNAEGVSLVGTVEVDGQAITAGIAAGHTGAALRMHAAADGLVTAGVSLILKRIADLG
jgi:hypothetical protein